MDKFDMQNRMKKFALRVIRLANALPKNTAGNVISKQIIRSGTSTAANYRAACRARSRAEFLAKLCIVEEEGDETVFWLELIIEAGLFEKCLVEPLLDEANQLVAIIVSSKKTVRNSR